MAVDFLQGQLCSTENLAIGIWKQLVEHLPEEVLLHCVKLYETPRIYVDIRERKQENYGKKSSRL
jgi:6-pyruvoyltetrahydropterin/6-carboxytetrahydropterin synthase